MELLSLPTLQPQISCTVLWNLEQVRAGVVMVEFGARVEGGELVSLWPDASCPQDLEALLFHRHNTKSLEIQKNLESQNVVLWDVSCRYAQTPAATEQDLGVLLFRPKIVQKPDEPSNSQLTLKQNSIARSFSSAWLHKPALFPG